MIEKSEAPAGRPGPEGSSFTETAFLPRDAHLVHGLIYWLNVRPDGVERRFRFPVVGLRSLRVEVIRLRSGRLVEETKTYNYERPRTEADDPDEFVPMGIVPPRGRRWQLHEVRGDHSVWRRPIEEACA
jgi:hypothetical protein